MKSGLLVIALVLCVNAGALAFSSCQHSRSVCLLPKDQGLCKLHIPKYYFDQASGQCKPFIYGGCQGNENSFDTQKECETTCRCYLPKVTGPCKAHFPKYYFNHKTGKCEKFIYGGCMGNGNSFRNFSDCNETCACNKVLTLDPLCYLPKTVGHCRARMPRYFYNKTTRKCELFYYGGCLGNKNNFLSLTKCNSKCFGDQVVTLDPLCYLPVRVGPCRARMPRYFYNKATRKCELFYYGGCLGNQNNFLSLKECNSKCFDPAMKV